MSKEKHDERAAKGRVEQFDKPWMNMCLDMLSRGKQPDVKILDIGCGNGELADRLSSELNCQVDCLDYAPSHLARVKAKGYKAYCCHLDQDDEVHAMGKELAGVYDVVTALEVVEHLFAPDVLFKLANDVLKPGGLFVVSTPNMAYISYRLYSLFRGNLPASQGHHVAFFDMPRLVEQFFVCGFDVVDSQFFSGGRFYLDRASGVGSGWLRKKLINTLFVLGCKLGTRSLRHSGIIAIGRKSAAPPLGLSGLAREVWVEAMSEKERHVAMTRMQEAIKAGHFASHPDLIRYCSQNVSTTPEQN